MKKLLAIFTVILLSTSAMADQRSVSSATVTEHYKNVIKQTPYNVEVCKQVRQGVRNDSATNEIIGAILGGAIGNRFGNGDGKDIMTIFGALLGASMAHDQELVNRHNRRLVTMCNVETRYQETVTKVYSHSTITFVSNGRRYNVNFDRVLDITKK
jgi:uncharacterized protein YcfJ